MDNLSIRRVPLDALHLDPANARFHPAENLEAIEASLRRFGQAEPLVVHKPSGRVIGGNGRLSAMKKLGWTHADVVELEVDDLTATALGIALNWTADLATWDEPALERLLGQLRAEGALEGIGYDEAEVDRMLAELQEDLPSELEDPGPEEPPEKPVSRLGEHLLLCGDSTKDLKRLMGEEQADLVWTDPPYGVSYEGGTEDRLRIQNDDLGLDAQRAFLRSTFRGALDVCRPGACWYVAAPAGPALLPFAEVLAELGIWRQGLVWVKDALVLGHSDFHYRHEVLLYGWKEGPHQSPPSRDQDTVWEVPRPKASPDHPTTKPLRARDPGPRDQLEARGSGPRSLRGLGEQLAQVCAALPGTRAGSQVETARTAGSRIGRRSRQVGNLRFRRAPLPPSTTERPQLPPPGGVAPRSGRFCELPLSRATGPPGVRKACLGSQDRRLWDPIRTVCEPDLQPRPPQEAGLGRTADSDGGGKSRAHRRLEGRDSAPPGSAWGPRPALAPRKPNRLPELGLVD